MLVTLSGIVIDVSPVQLQNAPPPMLVTLSGIVISLIPVQLLNVLFPMYVIPWSRITST